MPTAPCTSAGAKERASCSSTTARTESPSTRAATRCGATLTADGEGGALRAQDLRTGGDPVGLGGAILRVDPATGAGLADQPPAPETRTRTRAGSSPTGCGIHSASRSARERTRSGSATSAGAPGRRSTASRTRPTRSSRTSAGRATRAAAPIAGTTRRTSPSARTSTRSRSARAAVLRVSPHDKVVPNEACPVGEFLDRRPGLRVLLGRHTRPTTTAPCSSPITRATASGRCAGREQASDPDNRRTSSIGRPRSRTSAPRISRSAFWSLLLPGLRRRDDPPDPGRRPAASASAARRRIGGRVGLRRRWRAHVCRGQLRQRQHGDAAERCRLGPGQIRVRPELRRGQRLLHRPQLAQPEHQRSNALTFSTSINPNTASTGDHVLMGKPGTPP